uniref:Uncharacterized protein n=1 Tax=Anguilla anguilla TaxID=7936 RepID=A0A0E9QJS4_ANGAN
MGSWSLLHTRLKTRPVSSLVRMQTHTHISTSIKDAVYREKKFPKHTSKRETKINIFCTSVKLPFRYILTTTLVSEYI